MTSKSTSNIRYLSINFNKNYIQHIYVYSCLCLDVGKQNQYNRLFI